MALTVDFLPAVRRSSDLGKYSAEVLAKVENHPITVIRHDGESFVLMPQHEVNARNELLSIAATLATVSLEDDPLTDQMISRYPWIYALTPQDQEQCTHDLIDATRVSFSILQPHPMTAKLISWREIATATATDLSLHPVKWLDDDDETVVNRS